LGFHFLPERTQFQNSLGDGGVSNPPAVG
jgi:hypothetical protein